MAPSLLRGVLRKNSEQSGVAVPTSLASKRTTKEYTSSFKSTSGGTIRSVHSVAGSVASFYSTLTGGNKTPKRRRPDVSRLGVPKFYAKNSKPAVEPEGVQLLTSEQLGPYTVAHGKSFSSIGPDQKPWGSIVLYNHGSVSDPRPIYHSQGKKCKTDPEIMFDYIILAKVQGELRLKVEKEMKIASIEIWVRV
jgi:hypothetical protein